MLGAALRELLPTQESRLHVPEIFSWFEFCRKRSRFLLLPHPYKRCGGFPGSSGAGRLRRTFREWSGTQARHRPEILSFYLEHRRRLPPCLTSEAPSILLVPSQAKPRVPILGLP